MRSFFFSPVVACLASVLSANSASAQCEDRPIVDIILPGFNGTGWSMFRTAQYLTDPLGPWKTVVVTNSPNMSAYESIFRAHALESDRRHFEQFMGKGAWTDGMTREWDAHWTESKPKFVSARDLKSPESARDLFQGLGASPNRVAVIVDMDIGFSNFLLPSVKAPIPFGKSFVEHTWAAQAVATLEHGARLWDLNSWVVSWSHSNGNAPWTEAVLHYGFHPDFTVSASPGAQRERLNQVDALVPRDSVITIHADNVAGYPNSNTPFSENDFHFSYRPDGYTHHSDISLPSSPAWDTPTGRIDAHGRGVNYIGLDRATEFILHEGDTSTTMSISAGEYLRRRIRPSATVCEEPPSPTVKNAKDMKVHADAATTSSTDSTRAIPWRPRRTDDPPPDRRDHLPPDPRRPDGGSPGGVTFRIVLSPSGFVQVPVQEEPVAIKQRPAPRSLTWPTTSKMDASDPKHP